MKSEPRFHSFIWDATVTTAASGVVLVANLLSVSIVGRWMGAIAVGEYLLISRVVSWLSSGVQLGIGVALPRYVARAVDRNASDQLVYLAGALLCLLGTGATLAVVLLFGRALFARWIFGGAGMTPLVLPLVLMLVGQATHTAVYGFYRGRLWMHWAGALQVVNVALLPLAAIVLLFRSHSVASIVSLNGVAVLVASFLFLLPVAHAFSLSELPGVRPALSELLRYGVARVPGEFAGSALFALGPVIASHYLPISDVSGLLLGLGILIAISASVTPCGTVLLSKVSMMIARNQMPEVRSRLELFVAGVLEMSVFVCLQSVVFTGVVVRVWLGSGYVGDTGVIKITLLSVPFYLFFVAVRSAIDAASVVAYNAHNGYVALAVFLGLTGAAVLLFPLNHLLESIAGAIVIANATLAFRTARVARNLLGLRMPWRRCALPLTMAIILGCASYVIQREAGSYLGVAGQALLGLAVSAVFLWLSPKVGSTWLRDSWKLLMVARTNAKAQAVAGC